MPSVLAVLAAALLFGTTGTSQALGPEDTTPLSVGAVRLTLGGSVLALVAFAIARRRNRHIVRPALRVPTIALMALTGVSLVAYQPLFFLGTAHNGVAVGTVIALGSSPILAGLLEWLITRRRPGAVWLVATLLATGGVLLIGIGGGAGGDTDTAGLLGSLGAGASFAIIANAQRRLLDIGWDPFTVVGTMGLGAAAISIAALPFLDLSWLAEPRGALLALWLGLATIAVAYALFTWGLSGLSAATAATLTLGEPLTAGLLGVLLLGERLSALAVAGLVALASGLLILAWGSRSRKESPAFAVEG